MRLIRTALICASVVLASAPRAAFTQSATQAQIDSAELIYGRARRALDDKNYDRASQLFDTILRLAPRSTYAQDALYWKAFALYRMNSVGAAVAALETQAQRYPNAATREDAAALLMQLKAEQAKRGDTTARRDIDNAAASSEGCKDLEVRAAALDALQQMDADRVLPLLQRVLARRDACSAPLRKNALFTLAQMKTAERDKILLDLAKSDPNESVRNDAVFYLGQASGDAAVDALEDILLHADQTGVRSNALFALAQNSNPRARKIVQDMVMLEGAPMQLRKDALFHSAQRSTAEVNKWLAAMVANSRAPLEVRKDALFFLAQRKADASDDMSALYDGALPFEIKKDLLFFFAQRRDDKSLLKLIAAAKSDPSEALRKDALFYLAQSKDPRALKAIEEIAIP